MDRDTILVGAFYAAFGLGILLTLLGVWNPLDTIEWLMTERITNVGN